MTKAQKDLGKAIAKSHYVELKSSARKDAAKALEGLDLVLVYENDGKLWTKARTRAALEEFKTW